MKLVNFAKAFTAAFFVLFALPLLVVTALTSAESASIVLPPTPSLPPGGAADRLVRPDGADIWYEIYGDEASASYRQHIGSNATAHRSHRHKAQTITFLHGGLATSNDWGLQIQHLLQRTDCPSPGYQILAIDSRGHGRSSFGPSDQDLSYHTMAKDVVAVLDRLSIPKTIVVGWSDGGKVALDLALDSSSSQRLDGVFTLGSGYKSANITDSFLQDSTFRAFLDRARRQYLEMNPDGETDWGVLMSKVVDMWKRLPDWTVDELGTIDVDRLGQVWIAAGAEEEAIDRKETLEMHDAITGSGLVILPLVGHAAAIQDPKTFNAVLDRFLDLSYKKHVRGE